MPLIRTSVPVSSAVSTSAPVNGNTLSTAMDPPASHPAAIGTFSAAENAGFESVANHKEEWEKTGL